MTRLKYKSVPINGKNVYVLKSDDIMSRNHFHRLIKEDKILFDEMTRNRIPISDPCGILFEYTVTIG